MRQKLKAKAKAKKATPRTKKTKFAKNATKTKLFTIYVMSKGENGKLKSGFLRYKFEDKNDGKPHFNGSIVSKIKDATKWIAFDVVKDVADKLNAASVNGTKYKVFKEGADLKKIKTA